MHNLDIFFKGRRITVMGLGLLGRGLNDTLFLIEHGARVTVTDLKTSEQLASSLEKLKGLPVTVKVGGHDPDDFINTDMILRNADVPRSSPLLKIAQDHGVPVEMDESLFCKFFHGLVVGITGTRGKTTTTSLIHHILGAGARKSHLAGNIMGVATLPLLGKVQPDDVVVLELSSWQLQGFHAAAISPQASVFTNIYPDHMNRYSGMDEYIHDKTAIYRYQKNGDFCVFNRSNPVTMELSLQAPAGVAHFTASDVPQEWEVNLPGNHNLENVAAAINTTRLLGIDEMTIRKQVESFRGVEHRLQWLGTKRGIGFINDTTSTTPVSGIAALNSLESHGVMLIAGGADKKLDLTEFARAASAKAIRIALLEGTATDELHRKLVEFGAQNRIAGVFSNLKTAVDSLMQHARQGHVILLSPACASFGMFKNEFHRGESFIKLFEELKE